MIIAICGQSLLTLLLYHDLTMAFIIVKAMAYIYIYIYIWVWWFSLFPMKELVGKVWVYDP